MKRVGLPPEALRGPQHLWTEMRRLSAENGGFTLSELHGLTNGQPRTRVKDFVRSLLQQGAVTVVGSLVSPVPQVPAAKRYAVNVNSAEAPVIRRPDFEGRVGQGVEQLWRAIRALKSFTTNDLALQASTDDVPVGASMTRFYVLALERAGYLQLLERPRGSGYGRRGRTLRLRPAMNTGPKAPAVTDKGKRVVDRNRGAVVWTAAGGRAAWSEGGAS